MDRRNFLQLAALALAGKAAERVWPFRVYSIPKTFAVVPPLVTMNIYSPDFKVMRGSFLASKNLSKHSWDVLKSKYTAAIIPGDVIVPDFWWSLDSDNLASRFGWPALPENMDHPFNKFWELHSSRSENPARASGISGPGAYLTIS
jgi:hypothetical protein